MAVIAVDFDNTIFEEAPDGRAILIEGAREALLELKSHGHYLVIHTCRITVARMDNMLGQEIDWIERVLRAHGVPFDEIYLGDKMIADYYIDDRAVPFSGDWDQVVQEVWERNKRRERGEAG